MRDIHLVNGRDGYRQVVRTVYDLGRPRTPRGLATRDLGLTTITLIDPAGALPLGIGRNLRSAIGAVEALQLIAGVARPNLVLKIAPQFRRYMDPVGSSGAQYFHGAYGNRIHMQAACAVRKLQEDRDTRQAIITLWDPFQDNVMGMHDYPCTIGMGFSIDTDRNSREVLTMDVVMRSNDVWLGLPYDMFQFTQLQHCVATSLGMIAGEYRHTTFSLHMYEADAAAIQDFLTTQPQHDSLVRIPQPRGLGGLFMPFEQIMARARYILDNDTSTLPLSEMTDDERWFHDKLGHPHD